MANIALALHQVSVSYQIINTFRIRKLKSDLKDQKIQRFFALKDISFSLEQGKILGIIGKNGSGKSTLLKAIAGIFTPDKGEIDLKNNRASLLSLGVGFQSSLSGLDNIYLSGMLLGIKRSEIHKNVDEIIEFSELEDFIYKPVNTYSSGMVSKLAFSISSILDTDILLIDEVLSVGDVGFRKKSFEKIHKIISDKTKTVLLVSHDESMVRKQCDEAIWLEQGKIIQHGDTNATVDAYLEFMEKKK
jgi:ABC-type polysaccharide/polyol phosphate transport system ATPase subunit